MTKKQIEQAAIELCKAHYGHEGYHEHGSGPCVDCMPIAKKMIEQVNAALEEAANIAVEDSLISRHKIFRLLRVKP